MMRQFYILQFTVERERERRRRVEFCSESYLVECNFDKICKRDASNDDADDDDDVGDDEKKEEKK